MSVVKKIHGHSIPMASFTCQRQNEFVCQRGRLKMQSVTVTEIYENIMICFYSCLITLQNVLCLYDTGMNYLFLFLQSLHMTQRSCHWHKMMKKKITKADEEKNGGISGGGGSSWADADVDGDVTHGWNGSLSSWFNTLPSRGRPSSLVWWYTGRQLAWRTRGCRSGWCRGWVPAIQPDTPFHWWCSADRSLPGRKALASRWSPWQWCLRTRREANIHINALKDGKRCLFFTIWAKHIMRKVICQLLAEL